MTPRRLIVAMSGSSAPQLGRAVLQALQKVIAERRSAQALPAGEV